MSRPVHYSGWSGQPDVYVACGRWTTPAWTQPEDLPEGVHLDDGHLYSFDRGRATCADCLSADPNPPKAGAS